MKTPFYDSANVGVPLPEYPRPQLEREPWLNLNGLYDYAVTSDNVARCDSFEGKILVPFAIESPLSGVGRRFNPGEALWYRRGFSIPAEFEGKRVILNFGAVDWQCEVFINGLSAGAHTGGYCSFSFDITGLLREGENELKLRVVDPTDRGPQQRGKQAAKSHSIWYTATSGVWQTVFIEAVDENYIKKIKLTPDTDSGVLKIETVFDGAEDCEIKAFVFDGEKLIAQKAVITDDYIPVPEFEFWSPENPKLYDLRLELYREGELRDSVKSYFGMRKFSIEKDGNGIPRLFLNGEPYFQRGLLDQGYWPDGGLTAPSDEALIYDIKTMKELGFNMLRKHIKTEPARWYYHCDRLGMLVWQDMISGGDYIKLIYGALPNIGVKLRDDKNYKRFNREKPEWREAFRRELFEMIDMLYNAVSICCWVPFNECWGQFDAKKIGESVKEYDPTRHVDHASGWYDQGGPDLLSMHRYILPVKMPGLDGRPFVLSEYGGYSMAIDGHMWDAEKSFGYRMFKTKGELGEAYKKLHERQIIPLIEKGLCATVYTQLSDVEFEVNGMLTYDRKIIKFDAELVKFVNKKLKY